MHIKANLDNLFEQFLPKFPESITECPSRSLKRK